MAKLSVGNDFSYDAVRLSFLFAASAEGRNFLCIVPKVDVEDHFHTHDREETEQRLRANLSLIHHAAQRAFDARGTLAGQLLVRILAEDEPPTEKEPDPQ